MLTGETKTERPIKSLLDPLYTNSLYLMFTNIFVSGAGFFFWIFAAKFYSPDQVGLAIAIISCISLISMFSMLGLDIGIIRYLPNARDKSQMINYCLTVTSLISVLISILFLSGLKILSPKLIFLKDNASYMFLFVLFTTATTILLMQINIFSALRCSKYSLVQTLYSTLRVILLPLIITYGLFGIYFSYGIGVLIASIVGNYYISKIIKTYKFNLVFKKDIFKEMFNYSFKNYISMIFEGAPNYILPLLVIDILGAEQNAYFYIAWFIASLFQMIPRSISISLLVEGSNKKNRNRKDVIGAIKFSYLLLLPVIILVFLFGKYILVIFGKGYSENSFTLLKILSIASIPYTLNIIYISIKRIEQRIEPVIYLHSFLGVFLIVFSILLVKWQGFIGVGVSWLLVNCIASIFTWRKILD